MAKLKVTYTLDAETIAEIEKAAEQLRRPKSQVVREAVHEYAARADRLTASERERLLTTLDAVVRGGSARTAQAVDDELAELRRARRGGGRGGPTGGQSS
jgi:hypothetical protein